MKIEDYDCDLEVQRYFRNRWKTRTGKEVLEKIIEGIKNDSEIRGVLDPYVLEHPENIDPYAFPIFPKDAMIEDSFWVLTQDDLRGLELFNEDLCNSDSLEKKDLSYSRFYNCKFRESDLQRTDLSYTHFHGCNMDEAFFGGTVGWRTIFEECSLKKANFLYSSLNDCTFKNSNLLEACFDEADFKNLSLDYLTIIDRPLKFNHIDREKVLEKIPYVVKAVRIAFERAELWNQMDEFIYEEKKAQRKYILLPHFLKNKTFANFKILANSYISNYIWVFDKTIPSRFK